MEIKYTGNFRTDALLDELLAAGVDVITVRGNVKRLTDGGDPDLSSHDTEIVVVVADAVRENAVTAVVDQHDATKVLEDRAANTLRREAAAVSGEAKLRTFYTTEVGLTDDEIDELVR